MFFVGRRHPLVYDNQPLNGARRWLAIATLVIFVLCFSLVPTRIYHYEDIRRDYHFQRRAQHSPSD